MFVDLSVQPASCARTRSQSHEDLGRSEKRSNSKGLRRIRQGGGKEESEKCSDGGREKIVLEDRGLNVTNYGTSLAVQWLRLRAPNARGMDSIPDQGTKIPHIMWPTPQKKCPILLADPKKKDWKYPLAPLMWRSHVLTVLVDWWGLNEIGVSWRTNKWESGDSTHGEFSWDAPCLKNQNKGGRRSG